mmetsp:Transcript_32129/g.44550  ORF Transcript_32129/g.44550 Transcript_32129/m.44550 type:complete len:285 (+) Transcript_32129:148-1002(+)|eukprot:CAMPEP_0196585830 /NCGR_PEP_ID=MMETSP1081-20130531/52183_1 /TAXON_ID=36882 /ORGANISM="Pyramimonas amylifera, Strain CCMP720" /LENGTH=284 /DNA_ID=CAMNT_0041907505 /DNA_START=138 /DNA_END=992 /DNA_ORIENTATION=-
MSYFKQLSVGTAKVVLREAWHHSTNAIFQRGFSARRPGQSAGRKTWTKEHEKMLARLENEEYIHDVTGACADPLRELQNGALSDKVKTQMYTMNKEDPERWTPAQLAAEYLIREERATAILVLKKREKEAEARGEVLNRQNQDTIERAYGAFEKGTGEKYFRKVATYPKYRVLPEGEVPKKVDPGLQEHMRQTEDQALIADFNFRLNRNLGLLQSGLAKKPRTRTSPPKPPGGYNLLIRPIGEGAGEAYVALSDSSQRKLTPDEQTYLDAMNYKPYKKQDSLSY